MTLDDLRTMAIARSFFPPLSLPDAIERLGFVQADPIRAPARAQDLILRHRVRGYRAGDLERRYSILDVEEDVFINYGFVSRDVHHLMHPRARRSRPSAPRTRQQRILAFVRERGEVHPREVDAHFSHGTVTNYWGGSSNATTHLLDALHYAGLLRVTRRQRGVRVYAAREPTASALTPRERLDRLIDIVVALYEPLPASSLSFAVRRLRYAVPQWQSHITVALDRARRRLCHAHVDGVEWWWTDRQIEKTGMTTEDRVRLLAPFDPVVWDRRRFELFWGWPYRFEAYTPVAKRIYGYYALPLLWRSRVIGWGNVSVADGALRAEIGYVGGKRPRERAFPGELEHELHRFARFLGVRTP